MRQRSPDSESTYGPEPKENAVRVMRIATGEQQDEKPEPRSPLPSGLLQLSRLLSKLSVKLRDLKHCGL
jgi:hypothetical protein